MTVVGQVENLAMIQTELRKRYADDYEILCEESPESALSRLERLRADGEQVVLLLAAHQMGARTGTEYFAQAHELFPHATRVRNRRGFRSFSKRACPASSQPVMRVMAP